MTTNRKNHLKIEFVLFQISTILFNFIQFVKCWRNFPRLNPKGPYLSLEKEKDSFCVVLAYFLKRVREIGKFHVTVVQRRRRNVQNSVTHVHSCRFADLNLLLFTSPLCRGRRRCLSSLLLWSRNFAAMVTWRHTSLCCTHFRHPINERSRKSDICRSKSRLHSVPFQYSRVKCNSAQDNTTRCNLMQCNAVQYSRGGRTW